MNNTPPTPEERIWAVLAHLSSLAFGMGALLPVIGWSEQRRKSRFASFHCLQALGYQSLGYTIWILSVAVLAVLAVLILTIVIALSAENASASSTVSALFTVALGVFIAILIGAYFLLPIVAAVSCGFGKDFHYPILGNRLAKYLGYAGPAAGPDWLIEDHEDRWVAAMGHFSVIIALWGLIAPITAWILQGRRSAYLKFQSVQTVAYQALVNLIYAGSGVIYMLGFMAFLASVGFGAAAEDSFPMGISTIVFLLSMLIAALIVLLMPLFHILGQWAGYRVLKGADYRYPIVGNLVERWMNRRGQPADDPLSLEGRSS